MDDTNERMDTNSNEVTGGVQQPGEVIRPQVGPGEVEAIALRKYGLRVTSVTELNCYDDRNYHVKVDSKHDNPRIETLNPGGYVMKIYNKLDSKNPIGLEAQHCFMTCLTEHDIRTQKVVPNLDGFNFSREEIHFGSDVHGGPHSHLVELRTFIPGRIFQSAPYTPRLLVQDGCMMGKIAIALQDFDHIYCRNRDFLWCITNVPLLMEYTFCLSNDEDKTLIEDVVKAYNEHVVKRYGELPRGYIHGDPNEQNILVSDNKDEDPVITGILDFTDVKLTYPVLDLAMNMAYLMIDADVTDQFDVPGFILTGYVRHRKLTEAEWDVLVYCMAGRLAQSLALGAHAYHTDPGNEYVLTTAKKGWPLLHKFWKQPKEELISRWKKIIQEHSNAFLE